MNSPGNYVELQSDNFGDWEQSGNFIRSSNDFRANPIGTFFGVVQNLPFLGYTRRAETAGL